MAPLRSLGQFIEYIQRMSLFSVILVQARQQQGSSLISSLQEGTQTAPVYRLCVQWTCVHRCTDHVYGTGCVHKLTVSAELRDIQRYKHC